MIKKETVLEIINNLIDEHKDTPNSFELGYWQALIHVKRFIDGIPDEDNWIPVSERLPE